MGHDIDAMTSRAVELLCKLVATPSVSRHEDKTADLLQEALKSRGVETFRHLNNIWCVAPDYDASRPTLLLNSHHDTVNAVSSWTLNPYEPLKRGGRIHGLGSNDAGASVVSLMETFCALLHHPLPYNLMLALSAEEEVSGENGMRALLTHFRGKNFYPDVALVGEPTGMQPAIGERGLVVLDCIARGKAGHAARNEGINAIYAAINDIGILTSHRFERCSACLGDIKVNVTQIEAGVRHNVIPDECRYVVDVRTTDAYTNEETAAMLNDLVDSECVPRSTRVRASVIEKSHPLVKALTNMGKEPFMSLTTSDMALMYDIKTVKMGPGQSSRSHTADEYVLEEEIRQAIAQYIELLQNLEL